MIVAQLKQIDLNRNLSESVELDKKNQVNLSSAAHGADSYNPLTLCFQHKLFNKNTKIAKAFNQFFNSAPGNKFDNTTPTETLDANIRFSHVHSSVPDVEQLLKQCNDSSSMDDDKIQKFILLDSASQLALIAYDIFHGVKINLNWPNI